ncbi:MAG TPA: hypothetical protein VGB03_07945 [Acidimicrobiales bacterium]
MAAPTRAVTRLDDRQQRLAYIGAVVAAVAFVAGRVPDMPSGPAFAWSGVGVAMAAFLAFAARRRSVVLTGGACFLISFGPWTALTWFLGAVYIAYGGLLMFRASKEAAAAAGPRPPRERRRKAAAAASEATVPAKPKPTPSKRYTPPKR